jgi:hypothetical protein
LRFVSDLLELRSHLFEDSVIEEMRQKCESSRIENPIHRFVTDRTGVGDSEKDRKANEAGGDRRSEIGRRHCLVHDPGAVHR